jgi:Zn-dependent protease
MEGFQLSSLALAPMWYVAFLLSITCHEAAHAVAAKWGGDPTAFEGGQASLNPWPHMRREPWGTILVPLFTFVIAGWMIGWASAPYDREWQRQHPRRAALMALAGPLANFALVAFAALLIHAGIALGAFAPPDAASFTRVVVGGEGLAEPGAIFLSILFSLNLMLGVFNLLPLPPLDGSAVVGLLIPPDAARSWARFLESSPLSLLGVLIAWRVFDKIAGPLFRFGLEMLYPGARYG